MKHTTILFFWMTALLWSCANSSSKLSPEPEPKNLSGDQSHENEAISGAFDTLADIRFICDFIVLLGKTEATVAEVGKFIRVDDEIELGMVYDSLARLNSKNIDSLADEIVYVHPGKYKSLLFKKLKLNFDSIGNCQQIRFSAVDSVYDDFEKRKIPMLLRYSIGSEIFLLPHHQDEGRYIIDIIGKSGRQLSKM